MRGVDLDIFPGECLGLVGDNAAGKSTLTKIISGTYIPDAGTITMEGEEVRFSGPRTRVAEILKWCSRISASATISMSSAISSSAANSVAGRFSTPGRCWRKPARCWISLEIRIPRLTGKVAQLSGGQRQAIAIARAASFKPKVLIMDEPTSALAVAEVEAVLALINRVKANGVSVILITHRLQDLFRVCDRIAVMYEGTKVAERQIGSTNLEDLVRLIVGEGARQ
ncbi:ATP-binding cassette domain-containing protein (plasmid) [Rhizobium ruizarguesonis]|nr:ATP-binding cassette domain-containing protein [Rhizobium ruizarguesonis]